MKIEKFAAIDVGTNSFHLIVVNVKENGNFEIIDREKEVIRLGEGSPGDIKIIHEDAIQRAIETMKRFKGIAESHGAMIRAVATSAVRESHNKGEFLQRVFDETGIDIEVISGFEEARLIYLGVLRAVPVYDKKTLTIDIGGGSTEFLLGEKGHTHYSISLKLGAVRLTQKFFPNGELNEDALKECKKWVEGEVFHVADKIKSLGYDVCVGSSGTIMSAGLMISAKKRNVLSPVTILNNYEFTAKELFAVEKEVLKKKSVEKRKKIPGLDSKRADIIPAGIIILSTIFEKFGIDKMTISGYALREGIVIDTLQKFQGEDAKPNLKDIRYESVKHLADSCNFDIEHCNYVAGLSLRLFDQLTNLHKLDYKCREYLEAAALLHDIGYHIAHTEHHLHSMYIIKNSELLGFNENEIDIIAHTARYHRKSHPKPSHHDFMDLSFSTQQIIKKLASILRIADSFDRTHARKIKDIVTVVGDKTVDLKLICDNDALPEIELWNLERRKGLFEEVFDKKIITEYELEKVV